MNNSDFYKLKYLKYKNKYISLKNNNQEGGLDKPGRYLFYIPAEYFTDDHVTLDGKLIFAMDKKIGIYKKIKSIIDGKTTHIKQNLSYEDLCDMAVLVIPYAQDKKTILSTDKKTILSTDEKTILSTDEWYIPQISKNSIVSLKSSEEPLKWSDRIEIDFSEWDKLFYLAREFLLKNKQKVNVKFNKVKNFIKREVKGKVKGEVTVEENVNIDELDVLCIEFDIHRWGFNDYIDRSKLPTFMFYKKYINDILQLLKNGNYKFPIKPRLEKASEEKHKAYDKYEEANKAFYKARNTVEKAKKEAAESALKEAESALKEAEKVKEDASNVYLEKKKLFLMLQKIEKFEIDNIEFLKKYQYQLRWFLEGNDINTLVSTTVQ